MKLSSKGRYGVRALFDIAYFSDGGPTQMKDIAERQAIPARFLEQIFQDLKKAGLIGSKRGPRGGYHLARTPDQVTMGDIVRALEGNVAVICPDDDNGPPGPDAAAAVFRDLAESVEQCFDAVSLADLCTRAQSMGVRRHVAREAPDYAI